MLCISQYKTKQCDVQQIHMRLGAGQDKNTHASKNKYHGKHQALLCFNLDEYTKVMRIKNVVPQNSRFHKTSQKELSYRTVKVM